MEEQKLRDLFEKALETHNDDSGALFLYSLMDFEFDYDEERETVHLSAPATEIMFNQMGILHGGIITYIADTAMGHLVAAFSDKPAVSLELKTQFLRSAKEGKIHAHASFLKKGANIHFSECRLEDDNGRLLANVTATFYTIAE